MFLSFVYVFHRNIRNKTHSKKTNRIERKKVDIALQNVSGGKYYYGPPNFIYTRKIDVKFATTFYMSYDYRL